MPIHFDVGGVAVKADTVSEGAELLRELLAPVKQKAKSNGSAPTNGKLKRDEVLPATLAYIGNSAKGRTTKQIAHYFAISSATASSRLQTLRSQGLINVPEKRGGYWTAA
jgi:CRP-like cAMP-binding protein